MIIYEVRSHYTEIDYDQMFSHGYYVNKKTAIEEMKKTVDLYISQMENYSKISFTIGEENNLPSYSLSDKKIYYIEKIKVVE